MPRRVRRRRSTRLSTSSSRRAYSISPAVTISHSQMRALALGLSRKKAMTRSPWRYWAEPSTGTERPGAETFSGSREPGRLSSAVRQGRELPSLLATRSVAHSAIRR
ncbi:hypothetical protein D3C80_1412980 [compost metagenome]